LPDLLFPGASITNDVDASGEMTVTFGDDLCRRYRVHQVPVERAVGTTDELKRFATERLVPALQSAYGAKADALREVDIRRGPAIEISMKADSTPCSMLVSGSRGTMATQAVPGKILAYAFGAGGAVYEIAYVAGDIDKNMYFFFPAAAKPAKDLLGKFLDGLSVPAGDGTRPPALALSPQSAYYAAIDVRASEVALAALAARDPAVAQKAAANVRAAPGDYAPRTLLGLAAMCHGTGDDNEAAFWFYASRLRAQRDQRLCTDKSAREAADELYLGSDVERATLANLDGFEATVKRVVEWDRNTPHTYDRRWLELLGQGALAARLGRPGEKGAVMPLAGTTVDSEALDEQDRTDFVAKYLAGIAKEREWRAVSSPKWERLAEFGNAVFYVDLGTVTVEGTLRSVWEVREQKQQKSSGAWSFANQNQYDCAERRYRGLYFSSRSGHMGEGHVIQWYPWTDEWMTDFTADSPAEKIRRAVCGPPVAVPKP
jgi:hypothetical protein